MTGSELFTGNVLVVLVGLFSRKWRAKKFIIQFLQFCKNLILSYVFNLLGAFLMAYLFVYLTQPIEGQHWITYVKHLAEVKSHRTFSQCLLLGIICNMLVTMATYNALAATTLEGKVVGIWFPIMVFVSCGFEHCVANAFIIPLGMLVGCCKVFYLKCWTVRCKSDHVWILYWKFTSCHVGKYHWWRIHCWVSLHCFTTNRDTSSCLLYYVYDYRNRHQRAIFNLIERVWKKIVDRYRSSYPNIPQHLIVPDSESRSSTDSNLSMELTVTYQV